MGNDYYESPALLGQYLLFHYGSPSEVLPPGVPAPPGALDYPARCARLLLDAAVARPRRALDLGCAVGGAAFALAREASEVVGVDRSRAFIAAARRLQENGRLAYSRLEEGERSTPLVATVPADIDRGRVRFVEADAARLPAELGVFDLVLLANLVDRLPDPAACLSRLAGLVAPGGAVLITSPYTWLETFTPRTRWLGGRTEAPEAARERIGEALGPAFALLERTDLPFLIREHARKFQWSVAEATLWRRV